MLVRRDAARTRARTHIFARARSMATLFVCYARGNCNRCHAHLHPRHICPALSNFAVRRLMRWYAAVESDSSRRDAPPPDLFMHAFSAVAAVALPPPHIFTPRTPPRRRRLCSRSFRFTRASAAAENVERLLLLPRGALSSGEGGTSWRGRRAAFFLRWRCCAIRAPILPLPMRYCHAAPPRRFVYAPLNRCFPARPPADRRTD